MSAMMLKNVDTTTKDSLLAAGGLLGAIGASSCCVLPLAFAVAGISGAWIGTLTKLAPYQPVFLAIAGLCIGIGFWRAYRPQQPVCPAPQCGTATSRRLTKSALWLAAMLLAVAATTEWWAPLFA